MSLLRNSEVLLLADLLRRGVHNTESFEAKSYITSLASCWACMAVAIVDTGKAMRFARAYQCWPVSVEFCVQLALNPDGLTYQVRDHIEKWLRSSPDNWCLAATIDQFDALWMSRRGSAAAEVKNAMSQLLDSNDPEIVAERMFGAHCMSTWPTYGEPALDVHIERKIKSLAAEQLAHVNWEQGLQLLRDTGVLDLRLAEMIGDVAMAYMLEVDLGL